MKKVVSLIIMLIITALGIGVVYLSQKTKEDQSATKSSAAISTGSFPFNGTYISFGELDMGISDDYLAELKTIGVDTIIIGMVRQKDSDCNNPIFSWINNAPNRIDEFLTQATQKDINVYLGLVGAEGINYKCYGDNWAIGESKDQVISDYNFTLDYLKNHLQNYNTIDGWYIPDEAQLSWTWWESVNNYYKEIVAEIRKFSDKPIIASPYLVDIQNTSPDIIAQRAYDFIAETKVDILAIQDSIGADCKLQSGEYSISDYFGRISEKIGKEHLWANNELFNCGYNDGWDGGGYQPTSIIRLVRQIGMTDSTIISGRVNWINQFHMTKIANNKMIGSERLLDEYKAKYGNTELKLLTPIDYNWISIPDEKYSDSEEKELFNNTLGNINNFNDPEWVGVFGNTEVEMEFQTQYAIRWISFSMLSLKTPSISFPEQLNVKCSKDGYTFEDVGTWNLDLKIYGSSIIEKSGPSEYTFSNSSPLNKTCKHIKVSLKNHDWTFIDEVSVVATEANSGEVVQPCVSQDINSDGKISLLDLSNLLSKYKNKCTIQDINFGVCGSQDSNGDGEIGLVDLSNLLSKYNKDCN